MGIWADVFSEKTPKGEQRYPFWHKTHKEARKTWWKIEIIAFIAITVCIFTLMSLYFGSYYKQEQNAYRVTCRIIDLDSQASPTGSANSALLGPAVLQAIQRNEAAMPGYHLGWQIEGNLERFSLSGNGVPLDVSSRGIDADDYARQLVNNQDVFGVVVIHANATSAATQAYQQGRADYSSKGAMSFYYEKARNFYTTNQYLVFFTTQLLGSASNQAGMQFAARMLLAATSGTTANFTALSTAISPPANSQGFSSSLLIKPFSYSTFNLHPFDQLVGTAATTAGTIYLIIFTFYISLGFKQAMDPLAPHLTLGSEVLSRMVFPLFGYFWISLMYSLVSLAFLVDFTRKCGKGGFPLYWCHNFVTMSSLGVWMELVLLSLGPMVFPFFYSFGWNPVDAAKSIWFGTKNHLGQNFAVNIAWLLVGIAGLALTTIYKRGQMEKQERQNEEEKKAQ